MGTELQEVYDFLLAKTDAKEWAWTEDLELLQSDWMMLLRMAIQDFLFPRVSLELEEVEIGSEEENTVPEDENFGENDNSEDEGDEESEEEEDEIKEKKIVFKEKLSDAELQVLATYMKHEWLKRSITNWKNIEMLYHDKDFKISGKAAHLNALINLEAVYDEECKKMANKYSRRIFDYTSLAGG